MADGYVERRFVNGPIHGQTRHISIFVQVVNVPGVETGAYRPIGDEFVWDPTVDVGPIVDLESPPEDTLPERPR